MKKIIKCALTLFCAATLLVSASACRNEVVNAYDIAKKNGFAGTEAEWLLSLHGKNGEDGKDLTAEELYSVAVEEGYPGTFIDFCATLDIQIPQYNDTVTIARNTCSVVSVYCSFSQTTSSGGWLGSAPSTTYGSQAGSGVIIDLNKQAGSAYILTNYHVVYNLDCDQKGVLEDSIWVYPYGAYNDFTAEQGSVHGGGIKATYVGGAMDYDIAVLRIEGSELLKNSAVTQATFGDSEKVQMGEETYAIGNPAGLGIAVTNGILSVPSEYIAIAALDNRDENGDRQVDGVAYRVMRTSAAINGGNSGGGLFNSKGELIGIVNAKSSLSTVDNMGYALPASQVKAVYENILDNGKCALQARLGVIVALQSSKAVVDEDGNVSVEEVFCVSQAAGRVEAAYQKFSVGDVFKSAELIGGEKVTFQRKYQLTEFLLTVRVGQTVRFTMLNGSGAEYTVDIRFNAENFTVYA